MPVAAAVVGSTLIGAVSADRAADKQASATNKGLQQSAELAAQSRGDALKLYSAGRKSYQQGLGQTLDFYRRASPSRYTPMIQGNVAAQGVIGQGAAQANNAILGLPVDMGFTQAQQITPDLSFLNAGVLPQQLPDAIAAPTDTAGQPSKINSSGSAIKDVVNAIGGKNIAGKYNGGIIGKIF